MKKNIARRLAAVITAVAAAFFITDTAATKIWGRPPVFCVRAFTLDDGVSARYYGAGYKIRYDYNIIDGKGEYLVTLWILPDSLSL